MAKNMSKEEAYNFIDSKPGWANLCTIGKDGFPHSITIGYFRDEDTIYMGCRDATQKVRNIERNNKVSVCLESGSTMADIRGVLLRGHASIVRETEDRLSISRLAATKRGVSQDDLPTTVSEGGCYIRIENFSITSWDYSA